MSAEARTGFEAQFYVAGKELGADSANIEAALKTQSYTVPIVRGGEVVAIGTRSRRGETPDIKSVTKGGARVEVRPLEYLASEEARLYTSHRSRILALGMAGKLAAMGIPMDGAKSDYLVAPEVAANRMYLAEVMWELERELALKEQLGPFVDVPAPDVRTNSWLMQRLAEMYRDEFSDDPHWAGSHTGKPLQSGNPEGGVEGRDIATSRGMRLSLEHYLRYTNQYEEYRGGLYVAVGFGNVGAGAALELQEYLDMRMDAAIDATTIVTAKDKNRPLFVGKDILYDEGNRGIGWVDEDVAVVRKRVLADHPGYRKEADDILARKGVKVASLAGLGSEIRIDNAPSIAAPVVIEGSNNGVDNDAMHALATRQVAVLDYRVANGNGVAVSVKEHEQNVTGRLITLEEVEAYSDRIMHDTWLRVFAEAERHHGPDKAIYYLAAAVTRVSLAEMLRRDATGGLVLPYDPRVRAA